MNELELERALRRVHRAVRLEALAVAAKVDRGEVTRRDVKRAWLATGDAEPDIALRLLDLLDEQVGRI